MKDKRSIAVTVLHRTQVAGSCRGLMMAGCWLFHKCGFMATE